MVGRVDQTTVLALSIANFANGRRLVKGALPQKLARPKKERTEYISYTLGTLSPRSIAMGISDHRGICSCLSGRIRTVLHLTPIRTLVDNEVPWSNTRMISWAVCVHIAVAPFHRLGS